MSRNRRFNWERTRQEDQARKPENRTSGPEILPVRRNTRLDGWIENKTASFPATCSVCGEIAEIGTPVQLKPPAPQRKGWRVRHEDCSPPG